MEIKKRDMLIGILILGSIWGFLEVVLGGGMKAAAIPYKGDLMTGLGIGTMAVAYAVYRRALPLIAIALIAVAVRQLAVPILQMPFMCKTPGGYRPYVSQPKNTNIHIIPSTALSN